MSSSAVSDLIARFLPVHRYTTMGDSYGSVCVGLSVPVSVHHNTRLTALCPGHTRVGRYQKGKTNLDFTEA